MKPLNVLVENGGSAQLVAAKLRAVPGVVGATAPPGCRRALIRSSKASPPSTAQPPVSRASSTAPTRLSKGRAAHSRASRQPTATSCTRYSAASPNALAAVLLLTLIPPTRAFRSVVLAVKAVILNLLSLASAFGIIVFTFQQGHGASLLGLAPTHSITAYIPVMIFAFLFGRNQRRADPRARVSGAVVDSRLRGQVARDRARGITFDATVIRALLVPALMKLFGAWNWCMPRWTGTLLRVPHRQPAPDFPAARPEPVA
jgi:putative drug exporter of the RND superfamily